MELIHSRQLGMKPGRIWWETIENYCDRNEIHGAQREDMKFHIKALDEAWLAHIDKKS